MPSSNSPIVPGSSSPVAIAISKSLPLGSLTTSPLGYTVPPPPDDCNYYDSSRGRSRVPKQLPYRFYTPSLSPSRSNSSSSSPGFNNRELLWQDSDNCNQLTLTRTSEGLGLSLGERSYQVSWPFAWRRRELVPPG